MFKRWFARPTTAPVEVLDTTPPTQSVLYADSVLYRPTDFPRYNPDDLIGRKGWTIYTRMMQDEQVKAAVKFRRNAVTSRDWSFEFPQKLVELLGEEEAERRVAVLTHAVRRMPGAFKRSLNFITKAMEQGFSITEKVYEAFDYDGSPYWGIKTLKPKPFDTFYPIVDEYGDLLRMEQMVGGTRQEVDLSSVIWYVINPEVDEFYGQSELREAYRDYYSKDILIKLENLYLERMAGGLVWAESDGDKPLSAKDAESLQSVLSNIQTKTGIQMPRNWQLKVNNPTNTTAFGDAIERHDRNIAKALLVPNLMGLTESGQTGSYSQSQTQLEGFLWMLDSDAYDLAELLNEQLFKPLCDYNWGDGMYPDFVLKPLSKSQLYGVLDVWNKLVQSGAVKPSETDEAYLRELLGFPETADADEEGGDNAVDPTTALNGAQVTALLDVVAAVTEGRMPKTTGVEIIVTSFPVSKADAERILSDVVEGSQAAPEDPEEPDPEEPDPEEPDPEEPDPEEPDPEEMTAHDHEHTFFPEGGMLEISYGRFARIQRRVDFAAIERGATMSEFQAAEDMGETMGRLAGYLADQVRTEPALLEDPNALRKVTAPADVTADLRKQARAALADGWDLGAQNAKREVEKAGMGRMSKAAFAKFASVADIATKYFNAKSFQMAGNLTDETLALFRNIILNGIKYSKSTDAIIEDIYTTMAQKGMISEDQAVAALGKALEVDNPTFRLQTVIKTNSFEAINEARFAFFTDPELGGFVTGLMYSAILDSRTTEICSALDDKTWAADSSVWEKYRPPNHYNCRSLLVAVTTSDEDVEIETAAPTVQPQEGFK